MPLRFLVIWMLPWFFVYSIPEKVLICGVCQDVEQALPSTIAIMEKIGSMFEDYRIIVYENNSKDGTVLVLREWEKQNSKLVLRTENFSYEELVQVIINRDIQGRLSRPEKIARARNIVLDIAMSDAYADFSYLIWIDMDFTVSPDLSAIEEIFLDEREWDAVFAYGTNLKGGHYDWYAFRDEKYPLGPELLGEYWWNTNKHIALLPTDDWYPVFSAFGGCGIYRKSSLEECRYSGLVTQDLAFMVHGILASDLKNSPWILEYFTENRRNLFLVYLTEPKNDLSSISLYRTGVVLSGYDLIWRVDKLNTKYPCTCEHVNLHAAMARRGKGKFFVIPRLRFFYLDSNCS